MTKTYPEDGFNLNILLHHKIYSIHYAIACTYVDTD